MVTKSKTTAPSACDAATSTDDDKSTAKTGMTAAKVAAAAAGVGAVAAAGYVASRALRDRTQTPKVFHLVPAEDGWELREVDATEASERFETTKKEALKQARSYVRSQEPSRLVVHRTDGTIQTSFTYAEDSEVN